MSSSGSRSRQKRPSPPTEFGTAAQRLRFHMEHTPLAVIEWGADSRIVRWSGAAERIFGWTAGEVLGKRIEDFKFVYDEDLDRVRRAAAVLDSGRHFQTVSRNRNYRKDGSVIHCEWYNSSIVDASGHAVSTLSLVLDTT